MSKKEMLAQNEVLNVVSVDDERVNLLLIEEMSKDLGLTINSFTNPFDAADFVVKQQVDLIFVDYMMPQMDGIEFIEKAREYHPDIPIVMITAVTSDDDLKLSAITAGATEFLNKPLNAAEFSARVSNLGNLRKSQLFFKNWAQLLEKEVEKATEDIVAREYETLEVLGRAAEYRDPETANHIKRVANYSRMLAVMSGHSEQEQNAVFYTSPLHDIGKLGVADSILLKPGKLTDEEFVAMKDHTTIGYGMIRETKSPFLQTGATIALAHHEKYAGGGYPSGEKGENIPIFGRIVAVADVFDALTTKRPYKEPWPVEKAFALLQEERGKHFDPALVDHFIAGKDQVLEIIAAFEDE